MSHFGDRACETPRLPYFSLYLLAIRSLAGVTVAGPLLLGGVRKIDLDSSDSKGSGSDGRNRCGVELCDGELNCSDRSSKGRLPAEPGPYGCRVKAGGSIVSGDPGVFRSGVAGML